MSLVYVGATRRVPARRARTGEQGNVMECLLWGAGAKPRHGTSSVFLTVFATMFAYEGNTGEDA